MGRCPCGNAYMSLTLWNANECLQRSREKIPSEPEGMGKRGGSYFIGLTVRSKFSHYSLAMPEISYRHVIGNRSHENSTREKQVSSFVKH